MRVGLALLLGCALAHPHVHREQLLAQQRGAGARLHGARLHGAHGATTQRWNGASSSVPANLSAARCDFRVPLDSEVGRAPDAGSQECHYIYCDAHHNDWPGGAPDWAVFGQFVPQLMRGFCTSANASGFAPVDTWLDGWHVQAAYLWSTPALPVEQRAVRMAAGALLHVQPGDALSAAVYYGVDGATGAHSYTLQIGAAPADDAPRAAASVVSQLVVTTPFMGTNPAFAAPYGSAALTPAQQQHYYAFTLGDLHEAWGMDEPAYYPTRMQWRLAFESEPAALRHAPTDACVVHPAAGAGAVPQLKLQLLGETGNATCAAAVMRTVMVSASPGSAVFNVSRALALATRPPAAAATAPPSTYTNPVVQTSTPDPGVLRLGDGSYVVATSSGWDDPAGGVFPLRTSGDLASWQSRGMLFPPGRLPCWASPPFYAPEIHGPYTDGSNGGGSAAPALFWAVYDAMENATGAMAVGAAWSEHSVGPFTDLGAPLRRALDPEPTGSPGGGLSAIDATLWQNRSDGALYLLWKNKLDANATAPLQRQIVLQRLAFASASASAPPALALVGGTARVLLLATEPWEQSDVEGPFVWEEPSQPGWLYLFYSGSNTFGSSYAVGVARSRTVHGPWEKAGAPLLHTRATFARGANTSFVSPGHNSVVRRGAHTCIVYHAMRWGNVSGTERVMLVDRLEWGADGWPRLANADGAPSDTPQPVLPE